LTSVPAKPILDTTESEIKKEIEQSIVTRLSRGNVSLQSGRYVTEQEITERYNKIKKFDFI